MTSLTRMGLENDYCKACCNKYYRDNDSECEQKPLGAAACLKK